MVGQQFTWSKVERKKDLCPTKIFFKKSGKNTVIKCYWNLSSSEKKFCSCLFSEKQHV